MRVLFVAKPHLPLIGGAQLTTHHLAVELRARGHAVAVLCPADPRRRPVNGHPGIDRSAGYPTIKRPSVERTLETGLEALRPDAVVVGGYDESLLGWARAAIERARRRPTVAYLHDLDALPLATAPVRRVLAVSRFLARRPGVEVVPPIVDPRVYRVPTTRRVALMVNPVAGKGVATALALARRHPEIPFALARCWWIAPRRLAALRAELRGLDNVELRDSVADCARLYRDARVLLVPSRRPEGFGRVVREAQASGIPVIASRAGALPEAVGAGGTLVDPGGGVAAWSRELARLWHDPGEYRRAVARARRQGESAECSAGAVGDRFEAILEEVAG